MTTRYVGPGGNDSNDGLSWANRKLTLTGAEDTPVVAGDTVYVGPGVYREMLTVDVSGTDGNPITYIGDVTGEHTDGVGGIVRVTGSDNDQTATRANCITASAKNYRTFRGLLFDLSSSSEVSTASSCSYWIMEFCAFGENASTGYAENTAGDSNTIRNCIFYGVHPNTYSLAMTAPSLRDNSNNLIENCLFLAAYGVSITRVGNVTIKNCTFLCGYRAVVVPNALTAGQTTTINNCIFAGAGYRSLEAATTADITENYNSFFANGTNYTNVTAGANSVTYPPLVNPPILLSGFKFAWNFGGLSEWSPLRAFTGTGTPPANDLYGITRPTTESKKSLGAIQYTAPRRDTATKRTGAASVKLVDASRHHVFAPTTNASTTFSVYVYWGADYAGTKPQLVVKQPGQSDTTVTATGSAESWEELTTTFAPAASPAYCVIELVSNNTAAAGAGTAIYFDDLTVT